MNKSLLIIIAIAVLAPTLSFGELTPEKGKYDPRVRIVDYNPLNVIRLSAFYGVSTHVQFADGETIKYVAVGDDQAWKVVPKENHLFIKPIASEGDTNVTVVTDKRTYQFALIIQPREIKDKTAWADHNLIFSLAFRYPDEEVARIAAAKKKEAEELAYKDIQKKLDLQKTSDMSNSNYWVAGSEEVSPTTAFDNGRFIFLSFGNNKDMPAIYEQDREGNESLINTNVIKGNTIVIQRMVERLILRKGEFVASVVNRSFDINGGIDNNTGTVAPDVNRIIKGDKR